MTRLPGIVRVVVTLAVGTALMIHVAGRSPVLAKGEAGPTLVNLSSAGELQKQFNTDRDHDRLVLLLSPT